MKSEAGFEPRPLVPGEGSATQPAGESSASCMYLSSTVSSSREPSGDPAVLGTGTTRLILTWQDPDELFSLGSQRVGQYVKAIFEDIGVSTAWKAGVVVNTADPRTVVVQVLLRRSDATTWGLSPEVMGVAFSKTTPQDTVYVFFPSVVRTLGYDPQVVMRYGASMRQSMELNWALSRVVAHEVLHAVAPLLKHASGQVMEGQLKRALLLMPNVRIHARRAETFRLELRKLAAVTKKVDK